MGGKSETKLYERTPDLVRWETVLACLEAIDLAPKDTEGWTDENVASKSFQAKTSEPWLTWLAVYDWVETKGWVEDGRDIFLRTNPCVMLTPSGALVLASMREHDAAGQKALGLE